MPPQYSVLVIKAPTVRGCFDLQPGKAVNPLKLETGLRPNSAGIPYTVLLRIEAIGFPTFGLLLQAKPQQQVRTSGKPNF